MALTPFKQIHTSDPANLDRIQTNVSLFADNILNTPILDGVLVKDISLSTAETKVNHKLGRRYRGWIIVDKNAQQDVWVSSETVTERFLSLTAAGAVTVSLWVF